ncbi:MAG: hypothetical protein DGJ47_000788, partial [Rickettsiaceae bacterium]
EMKLERLDSVIMEESQVKRFITKNPNFTLFKIQEYDSAFSIAMPKGSKLKDDVNKAIKDLKSTGVIKSLEAKWGI